MLGQCNHRWVRTVGLFTHWSYRFVDLFCGCGGISCGFRMAGLQPVLAVEKAKHDDPKDETHAERSYRRNFPSVWVHDQAIETLREVRLRSALGDETPHVIVGGPPCQAYSWAGPRRPNDPRGRMYLEYLRIVEVLRPHVCVIENVPGLLTRRFRHVLYDIMARLSDLGYGTASVLKLNSAWYGVPQTRERVIIIANRHGLRNPYPEPLLPNEVDFRTVGDALRDLADLPRDLDWNHDWPVHSPHVIDGQGGLRYGETLHGYGSAWERLNPDEPAPTVKSNNGGAAVHPWLPRVLTVRELARLQSFPDWYQFRGGVTAERRQVGNAVPPEMAKHIARAVSVLLDGIHGRGTADEGEIRRLGPTLGPTPEKVEHEC